MNKITEFLSKRLLLFSLMVASVASAFAAGKEMPQLKITYDQKSLNYETYIPGTMELTAPDGESWSLPAQFKTRGATARQYPGKPSLNMKLRDEKGNELDTDLLGLRKASSFILDAMAIDRINMRNRVCFDIWNSFSRLPYETEFGSRNGTVGAFVEVFINGSYKGIYCLSDKINRKLLDLKKPEIDGVTGEATIRGLLYKNGTNDIGNQNDVGFFNDYLVYVARYHDAWELHEPEDYASEEAWAPLIDLYENHSDYNYVKDYFWMENLADYTIHVMALCIQDNWGAKNKYFSIQNVTKDDERRKFVVTPWDLDSSLGGSYNGSYYDGVYAQWKPEEIAKNAPLPISTCIGRSDFKDLLKKRWLDGRSGAFAIDSVKQRLSDFADLFIESGAWQRTLDAGNPHDLIARDLRKEISLIGEWYETRFAQMDSYFQVTAEDTGVDSFSPDSFDNPVIYNIQGIPVKDTSIPGIYIVNGKKVLVR